MLVIFDIVKPSKDYKILIRLKQNKKFERYQFDTLQSKTLQMMMVFSILTPCDVCVAFRRDATPTQLSLPRRRLCESKADLWRFEFRRMGQTTMGKVHVNVHCSKA